MTTDTPSKALGVRGLARLWALSPKKIRALIRRGIIRAIDVGNGRSQLRITPDAIAEAERRLAVRTPAPRRRRRDDDGIDAEILQRLEAV